MQSKVISGKIKLYEDASLVHPLISIVFCRATGGISTSTAYLINRIYLYVLFYFVLSCFILFYVFLYHFQVFFNKSMMIY